MPKPPLDQSLMPGVLAFQLGWVDRDRLMATIKKWILDKSRPLVEMLVEQGCLTPADRPLLELLVDRCVERYGHDLEMCYGAFPAMDSMRESLREIDDPEIDKVADLTAAWHSDSSVPTTMSMVQAASPGSRFQILRPHAAGALGQVSVALDHELNREVAVKEIQGEYANDQNARGRFLTEAEITGSLEHPGIVPVYSLGSSDDGRPYYAMRFIRGISLKEAIEQFHDSAPTRENRFELRKLLGHYLDACNAIEYAHSRGVLHRDIKPSNIMLGKFGETLVVDWGLAKAIGPDDTEETAREPIIQPSSQDDSAATLAGSAIGTPHYMSPEQAEGRLGQIGPQSDVYGLGATLFTILTGEPPVDGGSRREVLASVAQGLTRRPQQVKPGVPAPLESICMKAMSTRIRDRYESPRALADDVERWLADEPVAAHRDSLFDVTRRWVRRHRVAFSIAIALLVSSSIALAVGIVLVREQRDIARTERDSATTAKREAQKANKIAQQNSIATRQVVEEFLIRIGDERWSEIPQFETVRIEMVELAVQRYQALLQQQPENWALASDAAMTYRRCANLYRMVNRFDDAHQLYTTAASLLEKVVANTPGNTDNIQRLLGVLADSADFYLKRDGATAAEPKFRVALDTATTFLKHQSESQIIRLAQARAQLEYGSVLGQLGRFDEALELEKKAAGEFREVGDASGDFTSRYLTVFALNALAQVARESGDLDEADRALAESVPRSESILAMLPQNPNLRFIHAWTLLEAGKLAHAQNDLTEAQTRLNDAVSQLEKLVQDHTLVTSFRRQWAETITARGELLIALDDPEAAQADGQQAVDLLQTLNQKSGEPAQYQAPLAKAHMLRAAIHVRQEDMEAAKKEIQLARQHLKSAQAANPPSPSLRQLEEELNSLNEQATN